MKNIIKTDFKRALKGAKFPLAIILMFFVWEFNSKRFADSQDVLYLFCACMGTFNNSASGNDCYINSLCNFLLWRYGNHFWRLQYSESRNQKYVISKIIVVFCTSFLVVILGSIIFVIWQCHELPVVSSDSITVENFKSESCFGWLLPENNRIIYGGADIFRWIILRIYECA